MRPTNSVWLACVLSLLMACETGGVLDAGQPDGGSGMDADGDGIYDADEGDALGTDTDVDGTPDYRDLDSDDDGIPDRVEAGDSDPNTPPFDSDADTIPDFQDTDADGNGILDADELDADTDLDGLKDYRDMDDDGDGAPDNEELRGVIAPLLDSDGDGVPNLRDTDSDNDLIMDGDERGRDTDGDGLLDWEDLDSDEDGIPDREEAGDADLRSPPRNSDAETGDIVPDYRDPDSDNDGLSDTWEHENGTDPTQSDSDSDGVSDLIEFAGGTDPLDAAENPRTRGDFVFVMPHMDDPDPARDTLEFRTNVQFADIYFLFDESGSMSTEIDNVRVAVTSLVNDLTCLDTRIPCARDSSCSVGQVCGVFTGTCIEDPGASSCLLSPWTGGAKYEAEYDNLLSLQPDAAATAIALDFPTSGSDEQLYQAVWAVADPIAAGDANGCAPPMPGRIGCPGFREDAVRILIAFTDEANCGDGTGSQPCATDEPAMLLDAAQALNDANINLIGVWTDTSTTDTNREDLYNLVVEAGSVDRTGAPLIFDGSDTGVVPALRAAVTEIVEGVPLRATIIATDEPGDDGDALQFIDYVEVNTSGGRCSAIASTEDTDGDTHADAFPAVLPGTPICWDVVPLRNDTVEPTAEPQVFRARLTVSGDGSPLDARRVFFLVPPEIQICGPDDPC